jgi:hypothetical protein
MPGVRLGRRGGKSRPQQRKRIVEIGDRFVWHNACPDVAGTSSEQDPQTDPGRRASFDVAGLVAYERAASGIEREVGGGLQKHPGIGLAPRMIATIVADTVHRMIGTVIDARDGGAFRFEASAHPPRHIRIGFFIEIAAADAGLVGDDDNRPAYLIDPEPCHFENSRDELELVHAMDIATIHIDDAIAIEKKSAAIEDHGCGSLYGVAHAAGNQSQVPKRAISDYCPIEAGLSATSRETRGRCR